MRFRSLTDLFYLLENFASTRHKIAPIIYKKIIFCLIENHANNDIREFILRNLLIILKKFPNIPLDILLEPLVK